MAWIACGSVAGWMARDSTLWPRASADVPPLGRETAHQAFGVRRPPNGQARVFGSDTALAPTWSSHGWAATTTPGARCPDRRAGAVAVPGRRLGPYRLIERVGRGRQADVWRASRCGPPMGEVALKVIPAWAADHDPRRLAQLRREAERGARLVSPSLLPTYDFGEADGLVFLAMPLVVGCSLGAVLDHRREILSGSPPPPGSHRLSAAHETTYIRTVTGLIARVARAVAAAHAARVVHRDIKPMNILVSRDIELDQGGSVGKGPQAGPNAGASEDFWGLDESCVYLCDFGLARDLDVATPVQLRDGAGSPLYMAPERLRKQPADEVRCDVYALGVTLFEALTLAPPIEVPPELPRLMWAEYLATAAPQRAGELCPALPRDLEEVIHRAMSRNPEHRHPTAAHLADDLQAVLARGVHAPDPGR